MLYVGRRSFVIVQGVVALSAAAVIAGCGGSGSSQVDPVVRAADVTSQLPGYRIAATATVSTPASGPLQLRMSGLFDRTNRSGTMTAQETVAGHQFQFTEVFSGLTFYMRAAGLPQLTRLTGGKQWLKFDMSRMLGAMGLGSLPTGTDPSQFVDFLRAVSSSTTKVGSETVRGVSTTHYRAVVDLNRYPKLVSSSQRAAAARSVTTLESALGAHTLPMDAWIDGNSLVRRLGLSFTECVAQQRVQFGMDMDIYDYGSQAQPQMPSATNTFDITPAAVLDAEQDQVRLQRRLIGRNSQLLGAFGVSISCRGHPRVAGPRHGQCESRFEQALAWRSWCRELKSAWRGGDENRRPRTASRAPARAALMDSARGQLLIAGPTLLDPNFWRTVVLVIEHTDDGALGLVLNRPSETTVGEAVPQLESLVDGDEQLYIGGPVQPSSVIVLAEFEDPSDAALISFDDIGVLGTGSSPEEQTIGVKLGRAFVGHAGWGPGQLDSELERDDWILEAARRRDAFTSEPRELWSSVLTRKGGSYALVARMPPDPSVN